MDMFESTGSFRLVDDLQSTFRKSRNSHRELHDMVFPNGIASTPSGNPIEASPANPIPESSGRRRMTVSSRSSPRPFSSVIARVPLPASPRPQRLASGAESRLSRAVEEKSDLTEKDEKSPSQRVQPAHRPQRSDSLRSSVLQRPMSMALPSSPADRVSKLERSQGGSLRASVLQRPSLSRPMSIALPSSPADHVSKVDRSLPNSGISRPSHKKRDSLVSQRVQAFSGEAGVAPRRESSLDALSGFPMPPLQSAPKRLDRSRYAFGS